MTRLGSDWTERYGYAPVLAETFVDPSRLAGTCYQAANWLYPISDHRKQVLCAEPEVALCSSLGPEAPSDWTEEEFGRVQFFDQRLKERLFRLATDFFAEPGELIPQSSNGSVAKKSGCRIEDRRLDDTHSLEASLAIDLVVAWRVYWLTMMGREKPDSPCDQILSEEEWHVLSAWATGKIADKAPSVQQAMHWIGKMGGWLARGKQDQPGTTCMWRGLARLPSIIQVSLSSQSARR